MQENNRSLSGKQWINKSFIPLNDYEKFRRLKFRRQKFRHQKFRRRKFRRQKFRSQKFRRR